MSKIGQINLDLQEQANKLGFSTVQDATDNGYIVVYYKSDNVKLVSRDDYEHEQAHKKWKAERDTVLGELMLLRISGELSKKAEEVINNAIIFITKGEV